MNPPLAPPPSTSIEALIGAGRLDEASKACESILARQPDDPRALFFRAVVQFRSGRRDEARAAAASLLSKDPGMFPARYLVADIDRESGRYADAVAGYGEALAREFALPPVAPERSRIETIVEFLATAPVARWEPRFPALRSMGWSLEKWAVPLPADCIARLAQSPLAVTTDRFDERVGAACALLGLHPQSSPAWMAAIATGVLVPWMRRALAADVFDNAMRLEYVVYVTWVRPTENQEHFRACFALWKDDMRAAGRRHAAALAPVARAAAGPRPRIAFFVHNVTMLAHVAALLEVIEGHAELEAPVVDMVLFYLDGEAPALERFRRAGVRLEPLVGPDRRGEVAALDRMRLRIAELRVETLAWITLATMMAFAFAMRIAPRQIWWAMKYYTLQFPEIDDYLTGGGESGYKMIDGRPWRVGPVVAGQWVAPELAGEARRIRAGLPPDALVLGSFAREEKLDNDAFLGAVAEILRARPRAVFLWTGRRPAPDIQRRFESEGVAARCHFIGWVNTKLYAQVIDVFLDSFPFPCGFTLYEAMAAGKAAVLFASPESAHGGINAIVGPLLAADPGASEQARLAHAIFEPADGTRLYLRASSPAEYVRTALALADDAALRQRAGAANREFIDKVMTDRRRAALTYIDHLLGRGSAPAAAA